MLILIICFLVCMIGLVMFCVGNTQPPSPRSAKVGEIMFACGLLALLLVWGLGPVVHLGAK